MIMVYDYDTHECMGLWCVNVPRVGEYILKEKLDCWNPYPSKEWKEHLYAVKAVTRTVKGEDGEIALVHVRRYNDEMNLWSKHEHNID